MTAAEGLKLGMPDTDRFRRILNVLCLVALAAIACLNTGCARGSYWEERWIPMTDAERAAVAEHAERILAATPRTLAGHDQDWDDAIREAHYQAAKTCCRVTFWEMSQHDPGSLYRATGRWKYAEPINPERDNPCRSDTQQ